MIETAFVFDREGRVLRYHLPDGRTGGSIPDSRDLWDLMWNWRETLGGVAHTHPGSGRPSPSHTDVTTFAACERGLGRRLVWPIASSDRITFWVWTGPGEHDYRQPRRLPFSSEATGLIVEGINRLRKLSGCREA